MAEPAVRNAGFIFLHRSIRDHWLWKDAVKFQWWVDILMECNHSDKKVSIGYELMECRRGQSLNSLLTWSKLWRVDISTVRRFLKLLENDKMIVIENEGRTTRLTVCNYDSYNKGATPSKTKLFSSGNDSVTNPLLKTAHLKDCKCEECVPPPTRKAIAKDTIVHTQSNRNAIQTITNTITNTEESSYSLLQHEEFKKFIKWINDHSPRVSKMKEPFTIKQFFELKKQVPAATISELLKAMHNWEPLLKKNTSSYLTILKWMKRETKNEKNGHEPGESELPSRLKRLQ